MFVFVEHAPSDACEDHCHWHNVDEPGDGYIRCFECGHLYRTARDLRHAYRRKFWAVAKQFGDPLALRLRRVLFVRASRIYFCQECTHDF